jgi:hypothetical protein
VDSCVDLLTVTAAVRTQVLLQACCALDRGSSCLAFMASHQCENSGVVAWAAIPLSVRCSVQCCKDPAAEPGAPGNRHTAGEIGIHM